MDQMRLQAWFMEEVRAPAAPGPGGAHTRRSSTSPPEAVHTPVRGSDPGGALAFPAPPRLLHAPKAKNEPARAP